MADTTIAGFAARGTAGYRRAVTATSRHAESPDDTDGAAAFDAAVKLVLAGDETAFRTVYRSMHPGLVRYLTTFVGPNDAEDVASDTWAQVCRDLPSFRGDGDGFRGWVTTIGRHRALDHLRATGRRPVVAASEDTLGDLPAHDEVDAEALAAISTEYALELLRRLPPEQAEAVFLRTVMGLDAKAAGVVLGKRPGAVRTAAYRGLRTLQAAFEATGGSSSDTFRAGIAEEVT